MVSSNAQKYSPRKLKSLDVHNFEVSYEEEITASMIRQPDVPSNRHIVINLEPPILDDL